MENSPDQAPDQGTKNVVFLVSLGSPLSPQISDVRKFLKVFLGDRRVVDINPWLWMVILNLFVLPFRPKNSARLYARIWEMFGAGTGFPLVHLTKSVASKLNSMKPGQGWTFLPTFLIGNRKLQAKQSVAPEFSEHFGALKKQGLWTDPQLKIWVIPQFPQFSESTSGSGFDLWGQDFHDEAYVPRFEFINQFHRSHAFITCSAQKIQKHLESDRGIKDLVLSFHGMPLRRIQEKGEVYYEHCVETFLLLKRQLMEQMPYLQVHLTFQSRFGREEWLGPYTDVYCEQLVKAGRKKLAVHSPSFLVDCLETSDELGHELRHTLREIGGELLFIPCLNDDQAWLDQFHRSITGQTLTQKIPLTQPELQAKEDLIMKTQAPETNASEGTEKKGVLPLVFLTIFLDLVGFSIMFPLFPALAKYYLTVDAANPFLTGLFSLISSVGGDSGSRSLVLFGGLLGALYSLLQFFFAPFWGKLSDRKGRRPIMLVSTLGLAASYVIWMFAGNFTILLVGRILGGMMGGNISTATAVVADVTSSKNRSKGMAVVGIAFALGFIIGPALGGIFAGWDLSASYPELGLNPFSGVALIAGALSLLNFLLVLVRFPETLRPGEKTGGNTHARSSNILKIFRGLPFPGVNLTNYGYFAFLVLFSGMEFTLTFLAYERLQFTPMNNAMMFVFVGLIIILIQGGVVRRQAHKVGEKKMALMGLVAIIPGLVILAFAFSKFALYAGLAFLALGSAMVIPCLTTLASLYAPADRQGEALGVFRSLGALARVFGPMGASLCYFHFGSTGPYLLGSALMGLPLLMISQLPAIKKASH